ncbi:MAG: acyltransferase family protein, partial [Solirubrobacteraceae bacterium]
MSGAGLGGGGAAERRVFPLFDSLRAIAALCIFGYHIAASQDAIGGTWLGNLNVGVPIFFVVSGFLLYRPFVARPDRGEARARLRPYAIRRVLRIVPA